jgi:hypothetical protein
MDSGINKEYQKIVDNEFPEFIKLLERCMNFDRWGFKQTFYGVAEEFAPSVIYDSESCRVRFMWIPADPRDGYTTLGIKYGRLHASNHHRFISWKGKQCHCWHKKDSVLSFLDGLSPEEAVDRRREISPFVDQFAQSNKGHSWSQVEWTARLHSAVWEHYGSQLFELFDLHRPDLWEQYTLFVEEFYRLKPRAFNPSAPPPENIC